jgi:hypothetical protein
VDFDAVADELYRLRPEDFTAARDTRVAAARTAGDRALAERIGKLRRPSLSAWVSNLLVHEQPGEVGPLLRLGEGLRQAHQDLDGAQLRELSRQQHRLISALSRQARHLAAQAGHPVGEDVQREVETTLRAVLADPGAAEEWAAGRLVKPLSAALGFPATAEGAVGRRAPAAPPRTPPARAARGDRRVDELHRRRLARARKEAEDAARELRAREKEATAAGRDTEAATQRVEQLQQRVGELTEELKAAKDEHRQARTAHAAARERERAADERVAVARRRAEDTAAEAERLASPEA